MIIVHKYGGSSVATTEKILDIAKYLGEVKDNKNDVVVVVSAMGKRTDALISLAKEITEDPDKREMDRLMSTGEQTTIALLAIALKSLGYDAISLTGVQAGIKTSGHHTKNVIDSIEDETERLLTQVFWEDSTEFERNHPMLIQFATSLGLDSNEIDMIFVKANKL